MRLIRLMLEYFHPWTNATGFCVASATGMFREVGLDVAITVHDPLRGDPLSHLVRGEVDFGVFPTKRVLSRHLDGHPVKAVAAVNQRPMEAVQTVRGLGIERPRDLAHRRVALNPTPRGRAIVRHLVGADGGDPDAVVFVDAGHREYSVDDILAGQADATFGGYWAWDALAGRLPRHRRLTWPVDEIGMTPYHSYLLGTRTEILAEDPGLVRAFLGAAARGYRAALQNPTQALDVLEQVVPYLPRDLLAGSLPLIARTWFHEGRWGVVRDELMQPYADWLAEHGLLATASGWRDAVDLSHLAELHAQADTTEDSAVLID